MKDASSTKMSKPNGKSQGEPHMSPSEMTEKAKAAPDSSKKAPIRDQPASMPLAEPSKEKL